MGNTFIIAGKTKKGIIEVIESKDKDHFAFGIQSHPEAEENSFFEELFAEFAKEAMSKKKIYL